MAGTYRIYGPHLDLNTAYVDVTIDGLTDEGKIEVSDDSGQAWTVEPAHIEAWIEKNTAHAMNDINTSDPVWSAVNSIETEYTNSTDDDKSHFINAVLELFKGA